MIDKISSIKQIDVISALLIIAVVSFLAGFFISGLVFR